MAETQQYTTLLEAQAIPAAVVVRFFRRVHTFLEEVDSKQVGMHKDLESSRRGLENTKKDLESTKRVLGNTRKELIDTKKALDGTKADLEGLQKDAEANRDARARQAQAHQDTNTRVQTTFEELSVLNEQLRAQQETSMKALKGFNDLLVENQQRVSPK